MKKPRKSLRQKIEVRLLGSKKTLRKGAHGKLRVTVTGLSGLRKATTLRLKNHSPEILRLKKGNVQEIRILPSRVGPKGTFVTELDVTGLGSGSFSIVALLGRTLLAHSEAVSKIWVAKNHKEADTKKWIGDGHN